MNNNEDNNLVDSISDVSLDIQHIDQNVIRFDALTPRNAEFTLMGFQTILSGRYLPKGRESILPQVQYSFWYFSNKMQHYTVYSVLENCSKYFGWCLLPSLRTHTTLFTVSGTCQTVTATYRYYGRVWTGLSVVWELHWSVLVWLLQQPHQNRSIQFPHHTQNQLKFFHNSSR